MNTVEENKIAVDAVADALADRFTDPNYAEKELAVVLDYLSTLVKTLDGSEQIAAIAITAPTKMVAAVDLAKETNKWLRQILTPSYRAELVKRMPLDG